MRSNPLAKRPDFFSLTTEDHPLKRGLVFAGLGMSHKSNRFHDSSLRGNHGTLTNMDPSTDWVFVPELGRWGLVLGNGESVVGTTTAIHDMSKYADGFTVSMWTKFPSSGVSTNYSLFGYYTTAPTSNGWALFSRRIPFSPYSRRYISYYSTATSYINATDGYVDEWKHHCVTVNFGVGVSIYIDGTLDACGADTTCTPPTTTSYLRWLGNADFASAVCDTTLFSRILTPSEIADLADPSNVYLSGLIAGRPRRRYFLPSSPAAFKAAWLARQTKIIGGGVS